MVQTAGLVQSNGNHACNNSSVGVCTGAFYFFCGFTGAAAWARHGDCGTIGMNTKSPNAGIIVRGEGGLIACYVRASLAKRARNFWGRASTAAKAMQG